jgi:hypothetical protein
MTDNQARSDCNQQSSDPTLTRQEFIKKVVKGTAIAGGALAAPTILDRFLVPKAYAACSPTDDTTGGGCTPNDATMSNLQADSVDLHGNNLTCGGADGCITSSPVDGTSDTHCNAGTDNATRTKTGLVCSG